MKLARALALLLVAAALSVACGGGESAITADNERGQLQGGGQAAGLSDNSQTDKTAGNAAGSVSNSAADGGGCSQDDESSGGDETVTDSDEVSGGGSNIGNQPVSQNYGSHGSKGHAVNPQRRRGVKC